MKVAIITDDALKEEWICQGMQEAVQAEWLSEPIAVEGADCYIDLLFQPDTERINKLKRLQPAIIIVDSVIATLDMLPENFIRINGWPGFLERTVVESSCSNDDLKTRAEKIISSFNKTIEWVPDVPGFITARVISTIINEAYFTLDEKVSSKKEIDIAMKLGTNYPYGPFEWSEKIGLKKVYELLSTLSKSNSRYEPAALLKKEALLS
ncbi:MAG TPA: 3-hydroxyacyl-CoA dehydrogenase family protein [Chitinophagaceae bacterium]|nr:3-hydroxyacyl-CoA dehydrogenase family protein [Chitinophagaceae bacterium]